MSVFEAGDLVLCLLIGVAFIVVVCRANRDDLPAIVRAIMRIEAPADSQWPQTMSIRRTGSVKSGRSPSRSDAKRS